MVPAPMVPAAALALLAGTASHEPGGREAVAVTFAVVKAPLLGLEPPLLGSEPLLLQELAPLLEVTGPRK